MGSGPDRAGDEKRAETATLRQRELDVAREIAHAFLTANSSVEVFRLALARLTPLVDAAFASVFLRDRTDPTLLKLACAQNWPQSSARFLGQLRIRVGRGPTGEAVERRSPVEVEDVFAQPALREWWDPARELGFVSLISLPLGTPEHADGALTFYFDEPRRFSDDERHLLRLAADQLGIATRRAARMEELRRENEQLRSECLELKRSIKEATDTRRLRDEFLSNISHELRTPLTSILGYADLLLGGEAGTLEPRQRALVNRVNAAATVLLRLISDLLELSQVKLGRAELQPEPTDAVLLVRQAVDVAGGAPQRVEFSVDAEHERMPIVADAEKITKVLENLLSNAFKFTTSGTVRVRVSEARHARGRAIEWAVQDTGIGIKAEMQENIFDEFRQVDGSSTRLYGGTGLGLALSRQLAALLGGSLTVESRPGQGTTFRFLVPVP
jgi:signal transduction histidine kinase